MNLLIDAHVFNETHQGTRTYIKGLYNEVIELMPEASFFFIADDIEKLKVEFSGDNVHFIQLKTGKFLRLLVEIPLLIWKYKIDFAHFQYISPPIKNCKHIVTTHDILFKDFKRLFPLKYRVVKDFLFRFSAKRTDLLLTVSEYSRQAISRHYNIPIELINITPNGVSSDYFTEIVDDFSMIKKKYAIDKYILYVSRVEPRKNHLSLLKAFYELQLWEQDYKLVLIGKKDFSYDNLAKFIEFCPINFKEKVLFLENIGARELMAFYKFANLFVYPSLAEGFGIPPLEAIAAGTNTLCSNTTAMSEFTFLGDNLFDPADLEELKIKIIDRLLHPMNADLKNKLRHFVKERYSWKESAKSFSQLLKRDVSYV